MLEEDFNIKLVILGDGGVGKTALANKFLIKKFPERYLPTLRHTIFRKKFELPSQIIQINVWDVGGQKSYNVFNPAIYKNVDIAILVFDLTKPEETLRNIKKEYKKNLNEHSGNLISIIIGNKLDSTSINEDLKELIKNNLLEEDKSALVSAKTGENVNECFELLIYELLKEAGMVKAANEFVALTEKTEKKLMNCLLDIEKIDLLQEQTETNAIHTVLYSVNGFIEKYNYYWNELEKINFQRIKTYKEFLSKISEIEKFGNFIKKNPIMDINILKEQLLINKNECETQLNYLKALKEAENKFLNQIGYTQI